VYHPNLLQVLPDLDCHDHLEGQQHPYAMKECDPPSSSHSSNRRSGEAGKVPAVEVEEGVADSVVAEE